MDYDSIWNNFLDDVKLQVTPIVFNTWFKDTFLINIENGCAYIIAPFQATKTWLSNNYYDLIYDVMNKLVENINDVKIYLKEEYETDVKTNILNNNDQNTVINNEKLFDNDENKEYLSYNNLDKKYTFDSFVVGNSNRFAFMSALQVAEKPAEVYNPLFIYGRSGLGKTHLMQAIGNYIVENTDKKVLYITTENFKQDFINITRKDKDKNKEENLDYIEFFKKKYRDIDVLMIDDIQFLENANKTQEEFTNTFNTLYFANKQIVICSDRSASDIKNLEERLKTRFSCGLTVQIDPPEFELKVDIIKRKIKSDDIYLNISDEVIEIIAAYCGNSVRDIEGTIIRLQAYCAIYGNKEITDVVVRDALQDYTSIVEYSSNNIYKIQDAVSKEYKLSIEDMKGKKRNPQILKARQVAMYLCRIMLDETLEEIGKEFGGKDHATVIHSFNKIDEEIKSNSQLNKIVSDLQKSINVDKR